MCTLPEPLVPSGLTNKTFAGGGSPWHRLWFHLRQLSPCHCRVGASGPRERCSLSWSETTLEL